MSLDYQIISQTTGNRDSVSQVLTQNTPARFNQVSYGSFFSFDYPVYYLEGATFDYYGRDYNSITYEITNGKIYTMFFTENVQSLSGENLLFHELYRITQDEYNQYLSNPSSFFDVTQTLLDTPFISIAEYCSGMTLISDSYTYSFPTKYKNIGNFTFDIFTDKSQYLLDNPFGFYQENDLTLGDAYYNSDTTDALGYALPSFLYMEPSGRTFWRSNLGVKTITGTTLFSGMTFQGSFFTYFVPPKKPNLNVSEGRRQIAVQGTIKTLSPIFNFNNTDDGDYYKLQVNYDINDTPYSGSNIFTYTINKQAGDAEFVRTFSTPLRANDSFIYRIGNTKEVENIFGNKQSITTWSDSIEANIESTGNFSFSGRTWRNLIDYNYRGYYHISGLTVAARTSSVREYYFNTSVDVLLPLDTALATINGFDTINVTYNGNLYTSGWTNAIYAAPGFSSMGIYILGGSGSAVTDTEMTFTLNTIPNTMSGVQLTLTSVFLNTSLDLGIDVRSLSTVVVEQTEDYVNSAVGQVYNRVSDQNGVFDFGRIIGGYYRLDAVPGLSIYQAYEPITRFITINSNTYLDLIFSIIWGNPIVTFDFISNDTFL